MLLVISPAKSLDYESPIKIRKFSQPEFLPDSQQLIDNLRQLDPAQLAQLMSISPSLAQLNHARFHDWLPPFDASNARQALFAFKGDVYIGLDAPSLSSTDISFAQNHLRILSGLYGLLRPLDLIQAYRLEMGTTLQTSRGTTLYEFWGSKITDALNQSLTNNKNPLLINLASNEYFKVINPKLINAQLISPIFKDYKNGQYKIISFFAKKARGLMSAYLIKNRIKSEEDILRFDLNGYRYSKADSKPGFPVFLRKNP
jgi:cytoplasmic iron level regulating protein YaaA (DUF328/UPF0246 family)